MATLRPKNGRTFSLCTRRPNAVSVQTLALMAHFWAKKCITLGPN